VGKRELERTGCFLLQKWDVGGGESIQVVTAWTDKAVGGILNPVGESRKRREKITGKGLTGEKSAM